MSPLMRLTSAALMIALLSSCDDVVTATPPGEASGKPPAMTKISQFDSAQYADVALAADGTLHAVFSEAPSNARKRVYYRASSDGGATWSAPVDLTAGDRDAAAGRLAAAVDGQGRVYALWEATTKAERTLDPDVKHLVYRVLENGTWSAPTTIDSLGAVVAWFAAADPVGGVHVVWSEQVKADDGYLVRSGGAVHQADLSGASAGAPRPLLVSAPTNPKDPGYLWTMDSYTALRGYFDVQGQAHLVAVRQPGTGTETNTEILRLENGQAKPILKYPQYATFTGPYYNPPELVLDAKGREHVLVQDVKGDRQAVLDFGPGSAGGATPVLAASDPKGVLKTFQVVSGPGGRIAVLAALKDPPTTDYHIDLFVTTFDGAAWSAPANLTLNGARSAYKELDGGPNSSAQVSTEYEPDFAAGRFGADGRLNLLLVNAEMSYVMSNGVTATDIGLVGTSTGGVLKQPHVFFTRH